MTIGQYIAKKKTESGLTAEKIVAKTGISAHDYADIVTDRRLPTLAEFSRFASVLDFSGSMGAKYRREITVGYRRFPVELEGDTAKAVIVLADMTGNTPQEFITTVLGVAVDQLTQGMNIIERVEYAQRVAKHG